MTTLVLMRWLEWTWHIGLGAVVSGMLLFTFWMKGLYFIRHDLARKMHWLSSKHLNLHGSAGLDPQRNVF